MGLALMVVGCASASLMPPGQAQAIKDRERALAVHADAIQTAISQSGQVGALAFLDAGDSHLVVLPGSSPADAWARFAASPEGGTGRGSVPPVLTFVHRADMPKAPEAVTLSDLEQQQALRGSLAALDTDLRQERQRLEERLSTVERGLAEAVATAKRESDAVALPGAGVEVAVEDALDAVLARTSKSGISEPGAFLSVVTKRSSA